MGLRSFHIVFIVVSGALCLWLIGWGYGARDSAQGAVLAAMGAAGFLGLAAYLRRFLRSSRPSNGDHPKFAVPAIVSAALLASPSAQACTVCMGQPDADTSRAFFFGIAFLAVLVLATLTGISAMMYKAAREHDGRPLPQPSRN